MLQLYYKLIRNVIWLIAFGFFFTGCAKLNVYKIHYNKDKQFYEYPLPGMATAPLRTNSNELVTEENFEHFITELSNMNFRYPFDKRLELANSPKESDYYLASLYSRSVRLIKERNYENARETLDELEKQYPGSIMYSDLAFLKGYIDFQRGDHPEATKNFDDFLSFSSQKYSERFRNYRYADKNDIDWKQQKAYATDYLSGKPLLSNYEFLREIRPKYYFTNLQPGFTLSEEGLVEHSGGIYSVSLGTDLSSGFAGGLQYYRNLTRRVDINPEFSLSKNMWEIRMALPVQLYRSANNRFGIKVSPFGQYSKINSFKIDGQAVDMNESVYNFGVKTSMGFYLVQRLSIGAYYTYNFYNADRPFTGDSQLPDLWWENEYDVSLYIPILKGLNLKAGIKSDDWVAGFYLPGWEIGYNINEGNIYLRTQMY